MCRPILRSTDTFASPSRKVVSGYTTERESESLLECKHGNVSLATNRAFIITTAMTNVQLVVRINSKRVQRRRKLTWLRVICMKCFELKNSTCHCARLVQDLEGLNGYEVPCHFAL